MATARLKPIKRLLIANRGEIACRIIKTAKRMNIETIAIYSSVDRNSMHVRLADEAYFVGEAEPQKSYLNKARIIDIALNKSITAIHPGYGFLSENADFSEQCFNSGLIFVGPKANSIRSMGIKNESKRIMIEAGVPVVPGYHGIEQDDRLLLDEAKKIGFPILIKPVLGGGGKGMRVVEREGDFMEALESSRRESIKSFNDQSMLLEKFILKPRHIEVQVFGDNYGNYVHLFERDCSIQRRHQKVIEEAPAPLISDQLRSELGEQAIAAARAVDYIGAGTVEFIFDKQNDEFYFMEMNTRLQVEHPITEMINNVDLVEWQLRVASGDKLPKSQEDIHLSGHAFEARIYAEDPNDNFLPQTGSLDYVCLPDNLDNTCPPMKGEKCVRIDTGITSGDEISPYYDPMIAKLIVWNKTRQDALRDLSKALKQYSVVGLQTNIDFLISLAKHKSFVEADLGTDFIDLHKSRLFEKQVDYQTNQIRIGEICAAIYKLLKESRSISCLNDTNSFRQIGMRRPVYKFSIRISEDSLNTLKIEYESHGAKSGLIKVFNQSDDEPLLSSNFEIFEDIQKFDENLTVKLNKSQNDPEVSYFEDTCLEKFTFKSPILTRNSTNESLLIIRNSFGENRSIWIERGNIFNSKLGKENDHLSRQRNPLQAIAPMPGIIEKVLISTGERVEMGQSLIIMSAMKMEYTIKANSAGLIENINCKPGIFVSKDLVLVELKAPS